MSRFKSNLLQSTMRFHHPSSTPPKVAATAIAITVGAFAPLAAVAAKVKVPAL